MIKYWFINNIPLVVQSFIIIILVALLLFKNEKEVVVIGVDKFGTRVLNNSKADLELKEQETVQFIGEFISYYFNFDDVNFKTQISSGSGYMSNDLWKGTEFEMFNKLTEEMKLKPFSLNTKLIKLEQIDDTNQSYKVSLLSELTQKGIKHQKNQEIKISIKSVKRDKNNPWGAEINELVRNI